MPGSESKLLKGLEQWMFWNNNSNLQCHSKLARRVYDDFFRQSSIYNQKLIDVRNEFEKYNLISALHTFKSKEDEIYQKSSSTIKIF